VVFCGGFANPGSFGRECGAAAHTPQIIWVAARASPGAAGVSETGRPPPVCIAISGPGPQGRPGMTVRSGDLSVLSI